MKAKLISTDGEYLEAIIEIAGKQYCVMDEFSFEKNGERTPKPNEEFEVELEAMLDEDDDWGAIFSSNPNKEKKLEHIEGWKYRAYGEITSINPVTVDCGIFIDEGIIHTNDRKIIGSFISYLISRLDVRWRE